MRDRDARLTRVFDWCPSPSLWCDEPVLAPFRRFLVAVFLVGCFVTIGAAPAQACTCAQAVGAPAGTLSSSPSAIPSGSPSGSPSGTSSGSPSDTSTGVLAQLIKEADAVFTGTVASSSRSESAGIGAVLSLTHEVVLDRVYKGRIDDVDQEVVTSLRSQDACGLGRLEIDSRYLFIVSTDAAVEGAWSADGCSGTQAANALLLAEVQDVLGDGRPPTPAPAPAPAVLSDVDTTEPTSFGRAAAPGAALVIVGFLGLILVGRLRGRG